MSWRRSYRFLRGTPDRSGIRKNNFPLSPSIFPVYSTLLWLVPSTDTHMFPYSNKSFRSRLMYLERNASFINSKNINSSNWDESVNFERKIQVGWLIRLLWALSHFERCQAGATTWLIESDVDQTAKFKSATTNSNSWHRPC